ncbi:MBL fold metallo-hydrolase [Glacieibacterium frigidum]|uniref:MBL fold metallo-hydrolase n=1 Tax=Glacieibacterium frigidum TaxID=2593303 RepID=UPI00163DD7A5|nr:MBL fold metallo-hydrolase [Glacieibacterium frigidum]
MRVTILGCGTSSGVPRIGGPNGDWGDCDPTNPRNRRRRVSILVEADGTRVLVDTGPDLRVQLIDAGVGDLDAVLYTHDHADHAHGIDDLRQVFHNRSKPVDCYAGQATWDVLKARFGYVFAGTNFYPATATAHLLPEVLKVGPLRITHYAQNHGNIDSLGFRFEHDGRAMAYSTDVKILPDTVPQLEGLDLWVVDALRRKPHPTHSHLDQTLGWIARFAPARAVLTHMDNSMDYAPLAALLPPGVEPGYDGMTIDI